MFRSHLKLSYELYSHYLFTFLSGRNLFLIFFSSSSHNKESSHLLHELAIFFLVCFDPRKFSFCRVNKLCPHLFEMKEEFKLPMTNVRMALLLLFSTDLLFFFFSFMKADVMFDFNYKLHSLS